MKRLCIICGHPFSGEGSRCPRHQLPSYGVQAWRKKSAGILREHRKRYGDWCPGMDGHPPHPSTDLVVDHVTQLNRGGSLLRNEYRVLCRQANSGRR